MQNGFKRCVRRHPDITNDTSSLAQRRRKVKKNHLIFENSGIVREFTRLANFWQGKTVELCRNVMYNKKEQSKQKGVRGMTVLVTGGMGYIGSHTCV